MNNKKNENNGWLIAVVVAIGVLLLLMILGCIFFFYKIMKIAAEEGKSISYEIGQGLDIQDEFDFDFDYHYEYEDEDDEEDDFDFGYDDDYDFDFDYDDYDFDYDYDYSYDENKTIDPKDYSYVDEKNGETYYTQLKDAVRYDLDYSIEWKSYLYDTDYENVYIYAWYPELKGENIPNLDYINACIFDEVEFWEDSFEEYVDDGYFLEDDEFVLDATAYVTYMDEEKISIVFSEYGYADSEYVNYLFSINIDVQNGVVLENSSIINMDDKFAVEFRERNKEQNDASGYIDELTDQEIVEYLNSPTLGAVFYTPVGLEVGVNLDSGWYTVTYTDYEKYLKKL